MGSSCWVPAWLHTYFSDMDGGHGKSEGCWSGATSRDVVRDSMFVASWSKCVHVYPHKANVL